MQTPRRKGLAVADRASRWRLGLTAGLGLALDLATKFLGWSLLGGPPESGGREVTLIPEWLRLVAGRNPGIVFGFDFGESLGIGPVAGRALTVLLTLTTSALIFYVFAVSRPRQKWLHAWCGLILAGAFGNLYDRLVYGHVRDLIQITAHATVAGYTLQWPYVFNVADVYLVVGVAAVALVYLFGHSPDRSEGERSKDLSDEHP
jgi:signal peptidase II